ncbi:MAG: LysR family transcriptional regulator [Devosia sp.]
MNRSPDWSLWRSFGAVVEAGSLSAAARKLGLSQPTLGRHIETLEADLGIPLFERTLQGLKPTETGLRLYEPVLTAERALSEAMLVAEGSSGAFGGTVRITASTMISHYVLPPMLKAIREQYPAVALELAPSDSIENLLLREADIAVRMFRPTQLELITRKLGVIPTVACAHESYLARRDTPQRLEDLKQHDLIGLDRSDLIIAGAKSIGFELTRADFIVRTDSQTGIWELLKAGLGISFAQKRLVADTPGMVMLLPEINFPLEVWLTTHRELFTSRRIRAIYDALAEQFAEYLGGQ